MIVEYWIASRVGESWLRLMRPRRRRIARDLPGDCALIARGAKLPAGRLWRAQDFAVMVWGRIMLVPVALAFPLGGILFVLLRGQLRNDVIAGMIFLVGVVAALSGGQLAMTRYRSDRTRLFLRSAGAPARSKPLPADEPGRPQPRDFWVTLGAGVLLVTVLTLFRFH